MNDEIKEDVSDLMELLETTSKEEFYRLTTDHELVVRLYNYITNLQQENERLKEDLKGQENLTLSYCKSEQDYKSRCEKAVEYNYELQERYCHSAIFDELVASKVYEITEKELNILQNGSDE